MRIAPKTGGIDRRIPELVLTILVLAALVNVAHRFGIDGRLPQPFVYDVNDTFMDWFNTAYYAHRRGAFDIWRTVYPPLSFVFLRIFGNARCYDINSFSARDCDWFGIVTILASYVIGAILAYVAFRRHDRSTALLRGLSFGLGLPMAFTLERGNLILPCFVFFVIAHGGIVRSRWVRAISVAVTVNFKPYLLLPVLASVFKREWRFLELAAIATLMVYLLTFAALGSGSPAQMLANTLNWVNFTGGFLYEKVYYSTSFAPFLAFDTSRFPTRDFLPSTWIEPMFAAIPIVIRVTQAMMLLCLAGAWLQPTALSSARLGTLMLAGSLSASSPGAYTEVFLIFLLFLEEWRRPGPIIAIVAGYLSCVAYDYPLSSFITTGGNSWLSGRWVTTSFGVAVGTFVRPGLVLVMFWALALDSLALIIREHRLHRPRLGMAAQPVAAS